MTDMRNRQWTRTALAAAALLVSSAGLGVAAPPVVTPLGVAPAAAPSVASRLALGGEALTDAQLGKLRGGFSIGPGFILTFSFQSVTFVNGSQVQQIIVPTTTVIGPGSVTTPPSASVISNNAVTGHSVTTSSPANNVFSQVIANTANNTTIQHISTVTMDAWGLNTLGQLGSTSAILSGLGVNSPVPGKP